MSHVCHNVVGLLKFSLLALLLINSSNAACVPLFGACVQSLECCNHPDIICRANVCFKPIAAVRGVENRITEYLEYQVRLSNLRESMKANTSRFK
ncbi:unnamed protein product [Bemisia tabaci]|uniref:Uncharacterized protein n=1 Tax=Bemisia tabaci TaxID=7038 RepID=A0A9P0F429_BEMTA|nr:unnamed protein product [Bemisia tabaci]